MKLTKQDIQNLLELHDMGVQVLSEVEDITPEEYNEKAKSWLETIQKV